MSHPFAIRPATLSDLDRLETLENRAFDMDRLSRRSLRNFIVNPRSALIVADRGVIVGAHLEAKQHAVAVDGDRLGRPHQGPPDAGAAGLG